MQATLPRHLAAYYSALQTFDRHGAASEGAVRIAFQNLLSDAGRPRGFTVLAEQTLSLAGVLHSLEYRALRAEPEARAAAQPLCECGGVRALREGGAGAR